MNLRIETPRHPGLDPGPAFSLLQTEEEGGCRVKPGMTI
jgi:hypothetical protein